MQDWIPERRQELIKLYKSQGKEDEDEISFLLKQDITNEYYERVCQLILSDQGISRITGEESLALLLIDQARTAQIVNQVIDEEAKQQADQSQKVESSLKDSHPLLSRVSSWLKRQIKRAYQDYATEHQWIMQKAIKYYLVA